MSERTEQELLSDIREALQRITTYVAGIAMSRLWPTPKLRMPSIELPQVASHLATTEDKGS